MYLSKYLSNLIVHLHNLKIVCSFCDTEFHTHLDFTEITFSLVKLLAPLLKEGMLGFNAETGPGFEVHRTGLCVNAQGSQAWTGNSELRVQVYVVTPFWHDKYQKWSKLLTKIEILAQCNVFRNIFGPPNPLKQKINLFFYF